MTSERSGGLRGLLRIPSAYAAFDRLVGAARARRVFVEEYLRPQAGERLLDLGCGPASLVPFLPDVEYLGVDHQPAYVETARSRYGDRGEFRVGSLGAPDLERELRERGPCGLVVAFGVLHHLDDAACRALFSLALACLRPGGRLVTYDGCFGPDQSRAARWLLERDRGVHVRDQGGYLRLVDEAFGSPRAAVRDDLLRIPYRHLILECQAPAA